MTPPPAIVALIKESNSSSPLMANTKCLGVMRLHLDSLATLPASSSTSAVKYSMTAATYTPAVQPTRLLFRMYCFNIRWILPTGKWTPARWALEVAASPASFRAVLPSFSCLPSSGRLWPLVLSLCPFSFPLSFASPSMSMSIDFLPAPTGSLCPFSFPLSFASPSMSMSIDFLPAPTGSLCPAFFSPINFLVVLSFLASRSSPSPISLPPSSTAFFAPSIFLDPFSCSNSSRPTSAAVRFPPTDFWK
mmetsp:Transcript_57097/g.184902  ORF Transcript_57097/g.184902 Transcript_57097/m.184902 type:complete len:248 (-) Transcript_57097:108-851(-)